jgi:hypothetical protein
MGSTYRTALHNKPYGVDKSYPVFHTLDLEEVSSWITPETSSALGLPNINWAMPEFTPTTYFLLPE